MVQRSKRRRRRQASARGLLNIMWPSRRNPTYLQLQSATLSRTDTRVILVIGGGRKSNYAGGQVADVMWGNLPGLNRRPADAFLVRVLYFCSIHFAFPIQSLIFGHRSRTRYLFD